MFYDIFYVALYGVNALLYNIFGTLLTTVLPESEYFFGKNHGYIFKKQLV